MGDCRMPALKQNRACRDVDQSGANDEHGTVIRLLVSPRWSRRHGPPPRQRNADRRKREYLTPAEVQTLMGTARGRGRQGHRDATIILVAYHHGLRASELVGLTWQQVDFRDKVMHITKSKNGVPSVHPMTGEEMRALRRLYREQEE